MTSAFYTKSGAESDGRVPSRPKMAAIVQGNVRGGLTEIIQELSNSFDYVILSTWEEERNKVPPGNFECVFSKRPPNPGLSNRNLQRLSTCAGLRRATELGCEFVLKWRTDLLPTALSSIDLLALALENTPVGFPSRIVMCPFRQLGVDPDWFSSFPDLFSFGHIEMLRLLWEGSSFDYTRSLNVPPGMKALPGLSFYNDKVLLNGVDVSRCYTVHNECYAWFKENLQNRLGSNIVHAVIARDFLALPDHKRWKICWFGSDRFRSICQAVDLRWLSEREWRTGQIPAARPIGWLNGKVPNLFGHIQNALFTKMEIIAQHLWWRAYRHRTKTIVRGCGSPSICDQ